MSYLWAISIRGPDDVIPAPDYMAAHKAAHRFNTYWLNSLAVNGLHWADPHMWATPIVWPRSPEQHASATTGEYAWLFSDGELPVPPRIRHPHPDPDGGSD